MFRREEAKGKVRESQSVRRIHPIISGLEKDHEPENAGGLQELTVTLADRKRETGTSVLQLQVIKFCQQPDLAWHQILF